MSTNFLLREVKELGKDVLYSSAFQKAVLQEHHYSSTVARHSLVVAMIALSMCYWLARIGIRVNKREVVIASLGHDLGILGRKTIIKTESLKILILNLDILKFAIYNSFIFCLFAFSKATPAAYGGSQKVLRELVPNLSEKAYKAVRWHMFPVFSPLALSWIGLIVTIADKRASFKDRKKNDKTV